MHKIEVTRETFGRFNKLRGFDTHAKFIDKLLDVYEESLKPKEEVKEAPKKVSEPIEKPKPKRKRKVTNKES